MIEIPIPSVLDDAVELAQKLDGVELSHGPRPLARARGSFELRFLLRIIPFPNDERLPEWACVRVEVDSEFPLSAVSIYSEEAAISGFPHQDAETGKLCLYEEKYAPLSSLRLAKHLEWAREWLSKAAQNLLLAPGDPYELPDFSRRDLRSSLPTQWPLMIDDSPDTFALWKPRISQQGAVDLMAGDPVPAAFAWKFWTDRGELVKSITYGSLIGGKTKRRVQGRWITLPVGTVVRNRPPQTFGELRQMCRHSGIDLLYNVRKAWEEKNENPKLAVVLIGFPISTIVGEPPAEMHWQPLWFNGWTRDKIGKPRYGRYSRSGLWNLGINQGRFGDKEQLPWGKCENVAPARLYARGGHPAIAVSTPICVAGCGALGCIVAELVARGGARTLDLIDKDSFELGNQCRHTLDGTTVGEGKAMALAQRLAAANPLSEIRGHLAQLPFVTNPPEFVEAWRAIESARLIIDCTTEPSAFKWLNVVAKHSRARVAKMFINVGASILTLCVSGQHASCEKVYTKLCADIASGNPISTSEHDGENEGTMLLRPGAGCWHSTFPAVNSHLWQLASIAVDLLNGILSQHIRSYGFGILVRRNDLRGGTKAAIEVIWNKEYR